MDTDQPTDTATHPGAKTIGIVLKNKNARSKKSFFLGLAFAGGVLAASSQTLASGSIRVASATTTNQLSIACSWTEPFDSMEISQGQITYSFSGDKAEQMQTPRLVRLGSKITVKGTLASKAFQAVITKVSFSDSEPEMAVPYSVSIRGGEGSVNGGKGGCVRYGDGTTPRTVIGVATDDVLNIRSQATTSASVLDKVSNGDRIWVYPATVKGSWRKVSHFRQGTTKSKGAVIDGWVNAKFLSPT